MKPLGCDPARVKGMSEKLIVSHYENNYGGAVKRLNLIEEQLAGLDHASTPGFVINGLKREELIAMNSMILHEIFFDGLGDESEPGLALKEALARDFGSYERWRSEFIAMGKALAGGSGWRSCPGRRVIASSSINGPRIMRTRSPVACRSSRSTCIGAKAATYVDTFMEAVRWANADRVFSEISAGQSRRRGLRGGLLCLLL